MWVTCAHFYSIIMSEIYYNFQLSSLFWFQFGAIKKTNIQNFGYNFVVITNLNSVQWNVYVHNDQLEEYY